MISKDNQPIEQLDRILRGYKPSARIGAELSKRAMIMFSGPFAVGKTTLMQSTKKISDDYSTTRSFTTRPCRSPSEEENYRFIPHDEENLQAIIRKAANRELVQGMVHPTTRFVYGSELADYGDGSTALLDVVPKAVEAIEQLPFRNSRIIEVVALPDVWHSRVTARGDQHDESDIQARIKEARYNLKWALGRDDVVWIDNSGDIEEATSYTLDVIRGHAVPSDRARLIGKELLRQISMMQME